MALNVVSSERLSTNVKTSNLATDLSEKVGENKNRIINGNMTISQRVGATETTPTNGVYCLDRYKAGLAQSGKWKYQQVTESPDEFTKSIVLTSTSAYTPTSNDHFFLEQLIEGYNVADLGYGTSSAKSITLSFWIKSSIGTGTYGGAISNSAGDRSYVWAVSVTGTGWQRVNVVIPGDTSGTWVKDTGIGLKVRFNLGNAGTWSATAGSWGAGNKTGTTSNVHLVATSAATLHLTGIQVEVGGTATDFEHKTFALDFLECQRYLQYVGYDGQDGEFVISASQLASAGDQTRCGYFGPTNFRATPSITEFGSGLKVKGGVAKGSENVTTIGDIDITYPSTMLIFNCEMSDMGDDREIVVITNTANGGIKIECEL